jgi:NAD(P)-dependent dehydrogenase (short-subunit alcohol dehydrogenase family)
MSALISMFRDKLHPPAELTGLSFHNKAVLVVGGNSGLGHAAAIKYAALGANPLILAVRTEAKGNQAAAEIAEATGCSPSIFVIETIDLASFASVRDFADRLTNKVPRLHVVQIAAGIVNTEYVKSADGYEMMLQVNVLSTCLLAWLLLPLLRRTADEEASQGDQPTHLTYLGSISSHWVTPAMLPPGQSLLERCDDPTKWDFTRQYFLVKLATWFFWQGLVERAEKEEWADRVIINQACPGLCKTSLARNAPAWMRYATAVQHFLVARTAEQGARSMVGASALGRESLGGLWRNDEFER